LGTILLLHFLIAGANMALDLFCPGNTQTTRTG